MCKNVGCSLLTLEAPITTAADDIHKYFSLFLEKIRLDVSSEFSAEFSAVQRIHMIKDQALVSSRDKSKKLKCNLLQFLSGALRAKHLNTNISEIHDSKLLD